MGGIPLPVKLTGVFPLMLMGVGYHPHSCCHWTDGHIIKSNTVDSHVWVSLSGGWQQLKYQQDGAEREVGFVLPDPRAVTHTSLLTSRRRASECEMSQLLTVTGDHWPCPQAWLSEWWELLPDWLWPTEGLP